MAVKKVVILGDAEVGKSSLMQVMNNEDLFQNYNPTALISSKTIYLDVDNERCEFNMLEYGGQQRYQNLRKDQYQKGDINIFVCSTDDKGSLKQLETHFGKINK